MNTRAYDAFVSYSHAVDGKLAPRLQSALRRFASPWYRRSALRVFRDETDLSVSPGLWSSIEKALCASKHLVLLASPRAAASKWVARELEYWLANKTPQTLLIVLTEGEIQWSDAAKDFDWQRTDALPKSLAGSFLEEPFHLDLRSVSRVQDLAQDNPTFRDSVATLTATLLGRSKDELIGEDIAIRRRARRTASSIGAALFLLTILLAASTWFALTQRDSLARSLQVVRGQKLAAEAQLVRARSPNQLELSALLSLEAMRLAPSAESEAQLRQTVAMLMPSVRRFDEPSTDSTDRIAAVAFSPDSRSFATVGVGLFPRWRDVASGKVVRRFSSADVLLASAMAVAFTRDGSQIITGSNSDIVLWNTSNGRIAKRVTTPASIRSIAVSSDDRHLATGHYGGLVRLAERSSGREVFARRHESIVNAVAFSPDSSLLASGSNDNTVRVWSVAEGKEVLRLPHRFGVIAVAFSPDGQAVASGGWENLARIWDLADGRQMATFDHRNTIHSLAFSSDGKRLATAGDDGTVRIWDRATGVEIARAPHPTQATGVAFSADGQFLVTTSTRSATVWKAVFGHEVAQLSHPDNIVESVDFSPDGKQLVTVAGTTARIWRLFDSRELYRLSHDTELDNAVFTLDGQSIVTVSRPNVAQTCIYVWAANSRTQRSRYCQGNSASAIAGDVSHVALGASGSLDIRAVATGTRIDGLEHVPGLDFQSEVVVSARRRRVAVASGWQRYQLYLADIGSDAAQSKVVPLDQDVRRLAFSPDERLLAGAGYEAILLWSADDGRELERVVLSGGANCVAFSPDGKYLASGGGDQSVRVWEIPGFREVARFEMGGSVGCPDFSPDMEWLAAPSGDRTARVWRWRSNSVSEACSRLNRNLTHTEWQTYLGDEPYRLTCPEVGR